MAHNLVIGIAGGSGSGKTTVAENIVKLITDKPVPVLGQDSYYHDLKHLPLEERQAVNFDHPDSLDNELLAHHLDELRAGRPIETPLYNYATHTREGSRIVHPAPVIVVEGILILVDRALRERMDIKLFVDIDADIRFIRRLERDVAHRGRSMQSVITQYCNVVRDMHMKFVEPSKRHADLIIPQGGKNQIAIDMVSSKIRAIMAEHREAELAEQTKNNC